MAKRPAVLPRWATMPYGSDELGWREAVNECSSVLHEWAAANRYGYYGDLIRFVPAIAWPEGPHTHEGSQIGHLLGQVAMAELDIWEDRPLISALVVAKEDNMPSFGFWSLLAELNIHVGGSQMQRLAFWVEEVKRCFATYGNGGTRSRDSSKKEGPHGPCG